MTAVGRLDWRGLDWDPGIQEGLTVMMKTSGEERMQTRPDGAEKNNVMTN